jgi:ketosteroid isomerase-like protein
MILEPGIVGILQKYETTVFHRDLEGHLALYSDQAQIFDAWDDWSFKGIEPLRKMVESWFVSLDEDRVKVEMSDLRTQSGGDIGYASAIVKFTAISKEGSPLRWLENRFTWVLERKHNEWKIMHQHSSSPANHETLKIELRRSR